VLDGFEGEDHPLIFIDHVSELFDEKRQVILATFMGASVHGCHDLSLRPWFGM
jgi:hypothetical protein